MRQRSKIGEQFRRRNAPPILIAAQQWDAHMGSPENSRHRSNPVGEITFVGRIRLFAPQGNTAHSRVFSSFVSDATYSCLI
jgi:hypothetical protein